MSRRSRRYLALLPIAALTLVLTLLLSGGGNARAVLQVSPISTPTRFVPTASPPTVPTSDFVDQPTVEPLPSLEPPTSVPLPPTVGQTPTPLGFLPAPTIVNPDEVKSMPLAQPPVSGGGGAADPLEASGAPVSSNSTARVAVELLNDLWLFCGGALLIGGAAAIYLIWRRDRST